MGIGLKHGQSAIAARHAHRQGRRFRVLSQHSDRLVQDNGDLFSGGSDISLLQVRDAFASVEHSDVGQLSIGRVRSSGHDVYVREPHSVTLIVPLSGRITIEDRNGRYTARPGGALLAPMGQRKTRVEAGDDAPFVGIPILLPRSTLEAFGRHEGFQVTTVLNGSRSTLHAQAIRMATLLQEELRHGTGLLERPSAERSWTELMTEIVVDIIYQGSGLSIAADCAGSVKARRVRAAEAFMRANLSEIATLSDVARSLGISTRALELAFRSEYDISPLRFLTGLRLSEARRILVSDTDITSVTEVCLACGIGHAGRFATSYRKRYGEAPSETLLHR